MDLVIAMDSSKADKASFQKQKAIAKLFIQKMTSVVPSYSIELILYGTMSTSSGHFSQNDRIEQINDVIDFLPQFTRQRQIDQGLVAASNYFKGKGTKSMSSVRLLVMFATGPHPTIQREVIKPEDAARALKDLGVKIIAIGTEFTPYSLLRKISPDNAFKVAPAQKADKFVSSVLRNICDQLHSGICFVFLCMI